MSHPPTKLDQKKGKQRIFGQKERRRRVPFKGKGTREPTSKECRYKTEYEAAISDYWIGEFQDQSQQFDENDKSGQVENKHSGILSEAEDVIAHSRAETPDGQRPCPKDSQDASDKSSMPPEDACPTLPGAIAVSGIDNCEETTQDGYQSGTFGASRGSLGSLWSYGEKNSNIKSSKNSLVALEATLVEEGDITTESREKLKEEIRNEFLKSAIVGEASKIDLPNSKESTRPRRSIRCILAAIMFFVIGSCALLVMRLDLSRQSSVSLSPSPATLSPSIEPTFAPSKSILNLDNALFQEAHPLIPGEDPIESARESILQSYEIECSNSMEKDNYGVWYTYQARSSGPVTAIACGTSELFAYRTLETNKVACLEDATYLGDMGMCQGEAISWYAEKGQQYHVLLGPPVPLEESISNASPSIRLVDNDKCEHSFGPMRATSEGFFYTDTTVGATIDTTIPPCGDVPGGTSPGVWYTVQSSGQAIVANTCSEKTDFDTQVSVYKGTCNGLVCVGGSDNFCGNKSNVVWATEPDTMYYIYVQGVSGATGTFELQVKGNY